MITLSTILSFAKHLNNKFVLWCIIVVLILLSGYYIARSGQAKRELNQVSESAEKHVTDAKSQLTIKLRESELKDHLKDAKIKALLDSLKIKPKSVVEYKHIYSERTVHDTIFEHELIEISDYQTIFKFKDKCFTALVNLTGDKPTIKADISNEIYDIYYTQRRNLFNSKLLPKWGKKDYYQTLILPCGNDTIRKNYLITTQ